MHVCAVDVLHVTHYLGSAWTFTHYFSIFLPSSVNNLWQDVVCLNKKAQSRVMAHSHFQTWDASKHFFFSSLSWTRVNSDPWGSWNQPELALNRKHILDCQSKTGFSWNWMREYVQREDVLLSGALGWRVGIILPSWQRTGLRQLLKTFIEYCTLLQCYVGKLWILAVYPVLPQPWK